MFMILNEHGNYRYNIKVYSRNKWLKTYIINILKMFKILKISDMVKHTDKHKFDITFLFD